MEKYPAEAEPIIDTASSVGRVPRQPTTKPFIPIGHTALERCPDYDARFSYPENTIWLKSLYISWALQTAGLGRSAMVLTELIAKSPPHNAELLALDTLKGSYQVSEKHLGHLYDDRGMERPAVIRSNEEWYLRQGWELVEVDGKAEEIYQWLIPDTGEVRDIPVIYMNKSLVG